MNITPSKDSQPLAGAAEKPVSKSTATAPPAAQSPTYKSSPISPAWAEEVAASFGVTGQLAKDAAVEICMAVTAAISRKYPRQKLKKLVRSSVVRALK